MIRKYLVRSMLAGLLAGTLVIVNTGRSQAASPEGALAQASSTVKANRASSQPAATSEGKEEHAHMQGAHGGIIVSLGRDSYHVEAVFEKGGALHLYLLGNDETKIQEVDVQNLTAYVKASDGNESVPIAITPQPQPDDAGGKTSVFVGKLPDGLAGKNVDVTIPSLRIGGERFRLGFTSAPQTHDEDTMPEKVSDDAERELYLTPGGLYTQADIEANGHLTASQKFKGFRAKHDLHPKPGDKICPVTLTLANPACTWIIGGKKYEFCCPPCVDNFLETAKNNETAKDVQDPEAYVQK